MSLPVTEDTPPDMLAGSMDLKVVLPNGRSVKMSVQRGTPMMDLLVQVTTAHCLSPGDYSLQAIGDRGVLPFKPSTPIGALDTFTVKIVEKKLGLHSRGRAPQVPQSFLNTFRLQVHLPRSQLFVVRVTPDITLSEIMTHICTEKNLNLEKYEFRNPGNLDQVLELDKTLGDYKLQELSMMSKGNRTVTGLMSSADIINVKSSKQRQNSVCDSSLSSGSFGSRSGSPIPPINMVTMPPQPPMRKKRRPAPKPPTFPENEKKDQTIGSVLISHSRESSDSSGYHEASVLSESPIHGSPAGRIDGDSPPDTLPRRTKLPPSQSFTNLTSIQPPPKNSLTSSVSNTSLNSNGNPLMPSSMPRPLTQHRLKQHQPSLMSNCSGLCRKKRAPPPPPARHLQDNRVKSSTLPTSVTEERRSATSFRHPPPDFPVEVSHAKVQSPVETKASKDEVPGCLDVDVRPPPKPKPRTSIPRTRQRHPDQRTVNWVDAGGAALDGPTGHTLNRWSNVENLAEEEPKRSDENPKTAEERNDTSAGSRGEENTKSGLPEESSEPSGDEPTSEETREHADNDSINWEYQLPPPPTDFRDSSSPTCTEFGTVTITPEVLENVCEREKPEIQSNVAQECSECPLKEKLPEVGNREKCLSDIRFSQNKSVVMNELTNILNGKQKFKEKSLSVSNLYIGDSTPKDYKKNGLNYSRSFSTETSSSLENFKLTTYQGLAVGNVRKLSTSNEVICKNGTDGDSDITYRNNRNLEKSSSLECVQPQRSDAVRIIERTEEVFRKPMAPVQKKLKVAKRSASSVGTNLSNVHKRSSLEVAPNGDWEDDENIHILREQFLEFLKEKKLSNDLNVKSLDVIRNILPELSQADKGGKDPPDSRVSLVINQIEGGEEDKVKVKREAKEKVAKRYSYQGPPSINFGTWGERPKTSKIIIKDEDYVTREKVTEKSEQVSKGDVVAAQKPKEKEVAKRPAQIMIKKPGVLSRYEMFSALPRRKEASSLELVQMEDEERKKRAGSREWSRVPVVCGMELKKEFKRGMEVAEAVVQQAETKGKHSVSVYVNGTPEAERTTKLNLIVPKRNSAVMPVVKGFRCVEESGPSEVRVSIGGRKEQEGKEGCGVVGGKEGKEGDGRVSLVKLKGRSGGLSRQKVVSGDPRGDLLDEIRNFGGFRNLKRAVAH